MEAAADGLHVWLGMDGDAASRAIRLPAVLAELRRHASAGAQRLAGITCNGEPVPAVPGREAAGIGPARSSHGH